MDEKVSLPDSLRMTSDSILVEPKTRTDKAKPTDWIAGAAILLGLTLALFILFNQRSK